MISDWIGLLTILTSACVGYFLYNISKNQLKFEKKREKAFPCFDFSYSWPPINIPMQMPCESLDTIAVINFAISLCNNGKGAMFNTKIELEHKNQIFKNQEISHYISSNFTGECKIRYMLIFGDIVIQPNQRIILMEVSIPFIKPQSTHVIDHGAEIPESVFFWDVLKKGVFTVKGTDINENEICISAKSSLDADIILSTHPLEMRYRYK